MVLFGLHDHEVGHFHNFEKHDTYRHFMLNPAHFPLQEVVLHSDLRAEQKKPFDLSAEPVWQVMVFWLSVGEHFSSILMQLIALGNWSEDMIRRVTDAFYPTSINIGSRRDFAVWQKHEDEHMRERQRQHDYCSTVRNDLHFQHANKMKTNCRKVESFM